MLKVAFWSYILAHFRALAWACVCKLQFLYRYTYANIGSKMFLYLKTVFGDYCALIIWIEVKVCITL